MAKRFIILATAFFMLVLVFFPPFKTFQYGTNALHYPERSLGHMFITEQNADRGVDVPRLLIYEALILVAGFGSLWAVSKQRGEP